MLPTRRFGFGLFVLIFSTVNAVGAERMDTRRVKWPVRDFPFSRDFIAPLPPARPTDLTPPQPVPRPSDSHLAEPHPAEPQTASPDPACSRVLADSRLEVVSVPPISGPDGCGIETPVKLSSVKLDDGSRVAFEPPALIRCSLAEALGDWVRSDLAPLAQKTGGGLVKIMGSEGYECRPRNRIAGAKLSEHGKGNAYDMLGVTLHDGRQLLVAQQAEAHDFMSQLKDTACARFMTVLGPGSDGFHETHMHVDLAERHSNYRICQWELK